MAKEVVMQRIAVIGNYVPRQCGIATFTTDLCESLAAQFPAINCFAAAVNDREEGYHYPPRVRFELKERDPASYRRAADFLNLNQVDAVCLQHEFGIFGGPDGSHILWLLRDLRGPVVTTLHTVPYRPSATQQKVLGEIIDRSERVVVMTKKGKELLDELYGVPASKIDLIPHGIHDVPFTDPNAYKAKFGVEGKSVLLSFGLLGRSKGIENVIQALPEVIERFPNVVFLVVGATHPNVVRQEGESYRLSLQGLARELGVEKNVVFHNRFVELDELMEFLRAADVYVTPYLNQDQITSGTLAYALGAGKAVISTPYWHAEELLSDGSGILVPFAAPDALAHAVIHLLEDEEERDVIRKQAYLAGRKMTWPVVARQYMESFQQASQERMARPRSLPAPQWDHELLPLDLSHLLHMTDDVGMLQHAIASVPNYTEGYTTDDNARALLLTVSLEELGDQWTAPTSGLATRYLAFLWHAYNSQTGRFRNFMSYERRWLEEIGSPDSHARALWALGAVLGRSREEGLRRAAGRLFEMALPAARDFHDLRSVVFTLFALHDYLLHFSGDHQAQEMRTLLAGRLYAAWQQNAGAQWPWFEEKVTYSNASLPHALLLCGQSLRRPAMIEAALESLDWLLALQTSPDGHFSPIGNQGFYRRGDVPARFDQQPVEAQTTIAACIEAYRVSGNYRWRRHARRIFQWFLGRNDVGVALYDRMTGGCGDGLSPEGPSFNQGAESALAFLQSLVELRLLEPLPQGNGHASSAAQRKSRATIYSNRTSSRVLNS
jgi:glycosyltransferase involved in cell wall biosynthesis